MKSLVFLFACSPRIGRGKRFCKETKRISRNLHIYCKYVFNKKLVAHVYSLNLSVINSNTFNITGTYDAYNKKDNVFNFSTFNKCDLF